MITSGKTVLQEVCLRLNSGLKAANQNTAESKEVILKLEKCVEQRESVITLTPGLTL